MGRTVDTKYRIGFEADENSLQKIVAKAQAALSKISNYKTGQIFSSDLKEAADAAARLNNYLAQATNAKTGHIDLSQLKRSIEESGMSLKDYADKLQSIGPDGTKAFLQLAQAVTTVQQPIKRSSELLDKMWTTMANTVRWQISTNALNAVTGAIQNAYRYSQDLNKSLNNIRIVTEKNTDQMAKFAKQANAVAKALNTTTTDYTDASLIYYQQGDTDEEVEEKARITIQAANVARTSAEEMSEYLTAVWNSYKAGEGTLEDFVDKMSAVGAATATSLEEISTAMTKVASTAATVGVSFDQLTSIIATISSVTRTSPESVGTALKTVFARMEDLDIDGETEDGTTLGKVSDQLKQVGINVLDAQGQLRDLGGVIEEVGTKWQTWNNNTKVAVAQAVAGTRQYTQLMALFENWDMYQETLGVSEGSEGTLAKQAAIYAESWEAARNRVTAAAEGIYDSIVDEDAFIEMADSMVPVLEGIESIVDGLGGMKGVITTVSFLVTNLMQDKVANVFDFMGSKLNILSGKESDVFNQVRTEWAETAKEVAATSPQHALSYVASVRSEIAERQAEINSSAALMSDEQKKQARFELERLEAATQYLETLEAEIEKKKESVDYTKKQIANIAKEYAGVPKGDQLQLTNANLRGLFHNNKYLTTTKYLNWQQINNRGNNADVNAQAFDNVFNKMAQQSGAFKVLQENYKVALDNKDLKAQQQYLDEIADLFDLSGSIPITSGQKVIDSINQEIEGAMLSLRGFFSVGEQGEKQFNNLWNSISGQSLTEEQKKKVEESVNGAAKSIKGFDKTIPKTSDGLATLAASMTSAQMAGQGLINVFNGLSSGDLGSVITSLTQINFGVKNLFSDKNLENISKLKKAVATDGLKKGLTNLGAGAAIQGIAPYAAIALTAFTIISSGIEQWQEKRIAKLQEKANEIIKSSNATKEELTENENLITSYRLLMKEYDSSADSQEKIKEAALELIKTYRLEEMSLKALTGSYADYKAILNASTEARQKEIKKASEQAQGEYRAAQANLKNAATIGRGSVSNGKYTVDFERSLFQNPEFVKAVKESEYLQSVRSGDDNSQFTVNYDAASIAELYEALSKTGVTSEELQKKLADLKEALEAFRTAQENASYYASLLVDDSEIDTMKEYEVWLKDIVAIADEYNLTTEQTESLIDRIVGDSFNGKLSELHALSKTLDSIQEKYFLSDNFVNEIKNADYTVEALANVNWGVTLLAEAFRDSEEAIKEFNLEQVIDQAERLGSVTNQWNSLSASIDSFINSYDSLTTEVFNRADLKKLFDLDIWGKNGFPQAEEFIKMLGQDREVTINLIADKLEKAEVDIAEKRLEAAKAEQELANNQLKALQNLSKNNLSNIDKSALAEIFGEDINILKEFEMATANYNKLAQEFQNLDDVDAIEDQNRIEDANYRLDAAREALLNSKLGQQWLEENKIPDSIANQTTTLLLGIQDLFDKYRIGNLQDEERGQANKEFGEKMAQLTEDYKNLSLDSFISYVIDKAQSEATSKLNNANDLVEESEKNVIISKYSTITDATKGSKGNIANLAIQLPGGEAFNNELKAMANEFYTATDEVHKYNTAVRTMGAESKEAANALVELKKATYKGLTSTYGLKALKALNEDDAQGVADALYSIFGFAIDTKKIDTNKLMTWLTNEDESKRQSAGWDLLTDIGGNYFESLIAGARPKETLDNQVLSTLFEILNASNGVEDFWRWIEAAQDEPDWNLNENQGILLNEYARIILPFLQNQNDITNSSIDLTKKLNEILDATKERYAKINIEVERLNRELDKNQVKMDRAYGKERIKLLETQRALYADYAEQEQKRYDEAKGTWLKEDSSKYEKAFEGTKLDASKYAVNVFDKNGNLNSKFAEEYENAQHGLVDALKNSNINQKQYDEIYKYLQKIKETYDVLNEAQAKRIDYLNKEKDIILEQKTITLTIALNDAQIQKDFRALNDEINNLLNDGFNDILNNTYSAQQTMENMTGLTAELETTLKSLSEVINDPKMDQNLLLDKFKELSDIVGTEVEDIKAFIDAIGSMLPNAIAESNKKLDEFNKKFAHNATILTSIKEINDLMGQFSTQNDKFTAFADVAKASYQNELASLKTAKNRLDIAETALAKAQEGMNALKANAILGGGELEDQIMYDSYKSALDDAIAEQRAAMEAMLAQGKSVIEAAGEIYVTAIETAQYQFVKAISQGQGLELLQAKYDNFINTEERYLDTVNEAYEVSAWNRKLQTAIDETTSTVAKNRLKELQEEINIRKANNQLSKYDLEILNAKYEMTKAQMALEEAKNNASTMRLTRDSQGNFGYTFVADPDAIADAQQEYEDKANDYYNIAKEKVKETSGEILAAYDEMSQKVAEVYKDTSKTTAQREAEIAEIRKYYSQLIIDLESEKNIAITDMTEAGGEVIGRFGESYQGMMTALTNSTSDFSAKFEEYLAACKTALVQYEEDAKTPLNNNEMAWNDLAAEVSNVKDEMTELAKENGAIDTTTTKLKNQVVAIGDAATAYASWNKTLAETLKKLQDINKEAAGYSSELVDDVTKNNNKPQGTVITSDNNVNYAAAMAYLVQNYDTSKGSLGEQVLAKLQAERSNKIESNNMTKDGINGNDGYEYKNEELTTDVLKTLAWRSSGMSEEEIKVLLKRLGLGNAQKFNTGGYTGDFSGGKIGILHEKELVLNKEDTEHILTAVAMARTVGPTIFSQIAKMLDNNAAIGYNLMEDRLGGRNINTTERTIQQNVSIEANFPNVESAAEIETALNNLINGAVQYTSET